VGREGRLSEDFPVPGGLAAGSRVAGYRVEEPLGAGGMAVVYRARDERLRRLVALKVLAPALAADEEFRWRFTAESRAAAAVDHPNIIPVYEAGQAGRALFIAMRLVTGGDLRGVLAREGPLAPERMAGLLSPVASALDAAHGAGLVHRDVKPANVLVDTGAGRPEHVYLSDFGISKGAASSARLTGTGQFLGTPAYTSPEQVKGLAVDGRADQYALACVAWQLLTGTVPFQRDQGMAVLLAHLSEPPPPLAALRPGLPAAAGQVLARAMAKDPGERYPSCGEFTDALRDALALPPYQPAVPGPAAAGVLAARASALPASTVTTAPGAGRGAGGTDPHPGPGLPAAAADGPAQDTAAPGQRPRPGPGRDSTPGRPARPARRRRYLTITLACTLLAGAAALSVLLATPGTPQPPARPHTSTPPATLPRPRPATPTASATKPAPLSRPLTGTLAATLANPASLDVRAVAFGPGGTTLAAGDFNGNVTYLWDTATRRLTATLTGPGGRAVASGGSSAPSVNAVAFAPHGTTLAVADQNGSTYLWDTATRKIAATLTEPGSQGVISVACAPDGTTIATGDANGSTYLWDIATGKLTSTFLDPNGPGVNVEAFAPDSITLAVGGGPGGIFLWDTATGRITATLPLSSSTPQVNAVAFSPDGTIVAAGDFNGRTYLWDTATGRLTATLTDPARHAVKPADPTGHQVISVAFSPDGTTLAVADLNGSTYLWDVATGKITATLTDPSSAGGISVAFSPGGTTLAVGDQNGNVYLWRLGRLSR
jgi:sugar lactone lactonase YvrE